MRRSWLWLHMIQLKPNLQETIQRMKSEVMGYIAQGRIPATVSTFGELHDYIDANCLGGFCEDNGITDTLIQMHGGRDDDEGMPDQVIQYMNDAQNAIHAWLEAGEHKRPVWDSTGFPECAAKKAAEAKAAQSWCYVTTDGAAFYVDEARAKAMQAKQGGQVFAPVK